MPLLEGFGLPVVEAMHAGTPVVSSEVPAAQDATQLCDPENTESIAGALLVVASDGDQRRQELAKLAHGCRVEHLTWRESATRHVRLWHGLSAVRHELSPILRSASPWTSQPCRIDLAGVGRYCADLLRSFADLQAPSLTLYARRDDGDRWTELSKGARAPIVAAVAPVQRPLRLLWGEYILGSAVAKTKPTADAFFGPHYTMPTRLRVPGVVTVHDLTLVEHPEWHERSKVLVFGRAIRRAARGKRHHLCERTDEKSDSSRMCRRKGTVVTIPHGITTTIDFTPKFKTPQVDTDVLARLGVHQPYALNLGTIEPPEEPAHDCRRI